MWCVQEFRVNTNLGESPLHPLFVLLTEIADRVPVAQNVCRNFPVSEHLKHVLCLVLILFDPHSSDCDRSPFLLSDLRVIRTVGQRVTLMFAVSAL